MDGFVYIPGNEPEKSTPLARFLPLVPEGIGATFLAKHFRPEGQAHATWILDPFGASPQLITEIAANGYHTIVAVNNPVTRFLLEMAANPPSQADLRAALAELAASRKGAERLESHLQSLYLTSCIKCQRQVPVDAFIWERSSMTVTGRIYHCPCGEGGEYPATEADQKYAADLAATDVLHRARALERITAPDDPDRTHAEEALQCYLPRSVYALITIINKLDSLVLSPERRRAMSALILTACDEGSALWAYPPDRPRPKQLTLPGRFLEKNIWQALEHGVELWSDDRKTIQMTYWPDIPGETGGVCLFQGPMRELAPHLKNLPIAAVVTAVPRPNQAFWTLSALWAGWLWGKNAAAAFKSVLHRQRYDWNWHAAALYATLKNFANQVQLNSPLFTIIPELEPSLLSAAMLAAAAAGFDLSGIALRSRHDPAQVLWHRRAFVREEKEPARIDPDEVHHAIRLILEDRGEPTPYIFLHAAGLAAMAAEHSLVWRPEALLQIHTPILEALTTPEFVHLAESQNPESGFWALANWNSQTEPLPDRVEITTVQFLQKNPGCAIWDMETALNSELPGLLTPSQDLVRAVLGSYGLEADGYWTLRPEDFPDARRSDLEEAAQNLNILGSHLGYTIQWEEKSPRFVRWLEDGQTIYHFTLLASAVVGRLLRQTPAPAKDNFLVLPGGRAGLLAYKLDRDPELRALAGHWRTLKFRHLRRLVRKAGLTREQFEKESSSDPIEPPEQMKLF